MKRAFTVLIAAFALAGAMMVHAQDKYLIGTNSAGPVRTGMTIAQAKKALPGHTFKRTSDGEGLALVAVEKSGELQMTLFAGEEDPEAKINESAKIEYIEVFGKMYHTSFGVHPEMTVAEAEKKAGKLKEIFTSEIEAREFATFANEPEGYNIRVLGKSREAGIYPSGSNKTNRYAADAYVFSIGVYEVIKDSGFSSVYTDLGKDCKQQKMGEDAQHGSTMCTGPGGWRLHIFDSATTLEFNLEKGDDSVRIASQALSYPVKAAKLEWRLKDGQPFAAILRTYQYERGADGLFKYPAKTTGEFLTVKGLTGHPEIDYSVNARENRDANDRARTLADTGYSIEESPSATAGHDRVAEYNSMIDEADRKNEAWVRSVQQVIFRIAGEFSETMQRTISFKAPSADAMDEVTVTVEDDGFLDDSVRGERKTIELKANDKGVWKVTSFSRVWKCWEGRGHTGFSDEPCN